MQLDCVRRDAGLTVLVVEEGDAGCALGQILATASAFRICRRRYAVAPVVQSGERVSPIIVCLPAAQDEMVVEVGLRAVERHCGRHREDLALKGKPCQPKPRTLLMTRLLLNLPSSVRSASRSFGL